MNKHQHLVDYCVRELTGKLSYAPDRENMQAAGEAGLAQAAQSYDDSQGPTFTRWAMRHIRERVLESVRSDSNQGHTGALNAESIAANLKHCSSPNVVEPGVTVGVSTVQHNIQEVTKAVAQLPEPQQSVLRSRYQEQLSQAELATTLNCTVVEVGEIERSGLQQLNEILATHVTLPDAATLPRQSLSIDRARGKFL